jgi:hypothetical protein
MPTYTPVDTPQEEIGSVPVVFFKIFFPGEALAVSVKSKELWLPLSAKVP